MSEHLYDCKCSECCRFWGDKPVASPQATEMQTRILDAAYAQQKRMERVAQPAAGTTPCEKCGKPKFGPWSTIASGAVKDIQQYYCGCGEIFNGQTSEGTTPQATTRCAYNPHNLECNKIGEFKLVESDTGKEYYCCDEHVDCYRFLNERYGYEYFVIIKLPTERRGRA